MVDIVDSETRSRMMSSIRGKDTRPEILVRQALHAQGYRFRLHDKKLPGRPDIVLKKHKTVIFVHGCFWHGHDCKYFKWPKTRPEFWRQKIEGNKARDEMHQQKLKELGWNVKVVWECELKKSLDKGTTFFPT